MPDLPAIVWITFASFLTGIVLLFVLRLLCHPGGDLVRILQHRFKDGPGGKRSDLKIPVSIFAITFLASLCWGGFLYLTMVRHFYINLYREYMACDVLRDVLQTEPGTWPVNGGQMNIPYGKEQQLVLFKLLTHFNLAGPHELKADDLLPNSTNGATSKAWAVAWQQKTVEIGPKAIELVAELIAPGQSSDCPPVRTWHSQIVAAALAGQPLDWTKSKSWGAKGCEAPSDPKKEAKIGAGMGEDLPIRWMFERPPDFPAHEIVRETRRTWSRLDEDTPENNARDQFIARLMNEMRGVEKVRAARRWVNAIIGWERCAVIVLAVWFGVVFLIRDTMQLPHIVHSLIITDALDEITATGRASQQWPKRKERAVLANDLAYDLINGKLPEASDLQSMKRRTVEDPDHVVNTIPTRILLAAVDEMDSLEQSHSPRAGDPTFMENIAYGEKQGIDHSRLFFDALLPTFPAIGFVGTVSSLLIAMSKADKIVSTMEPAAKGIAAGEVTDILSLCFSTTFMALMCVLVFSPLSMAQRSREDQLIDQTEAAVHKNLRPHQS